ncbi:MAG: hypothetical protein FH748_05945 [Balneolaceae bacterium]|nr:hypothetical protein [Balneolaceae bacterium]
MESNTSTKHTESDNRIFLNGKQLAEVLGVSAPTITEAVKNGWNCGGYPVGEWAIESNNGRVKGYEVPEFLVSGELQEEERTNPSPEITNTALIAANSDKIKPEHTTNNHTNHYSLLPEGEDYIRPIGMVTLSSVIKKALESDTPQSKAIITGGLTGIGAIIGNVTTDDSVGTVIGALAGFGISYFSYHYFRAPNQSPSEINIQANKYDHKLLKKYGIQSGYILN